MSLSTSEERFPPKKIRLNDKCASCHSRIWYPEDFQPGEKVHVPPLPFKKAFVKTLGKYLLGTYSLRRCEVCGKNMSVFFEPEGVLANKVFVLYSCTLTVDPKDSKICKKRDNCYNCPVKGTGPGGL